MKWRTPNANRVRIAYRTARRTRGNGKQKEAARKELRFQMFYYLQSVATTRAQPIRDGYTL